MGLVVAEKRVVSPEAKHLERLLNGEMEFFNQIVIIHYRKYYSDCECHYHLPQYYKICISWLLANYVFLESFFLS